MVSEFFITYLFEIVELFLRERNSMNLQTVTHNNISFVNIVNPGEDELKHLSMNYGFNTLDLEDFLNKSQISKIETSKNYSLIVLDFPVFAQSKSKEQKKLWKLTKNPISNLLSIPQATLSSVPLPQFSNQKRSRIIVSQVYFFIGKDYLVVLHDNSLPAIHEIFTLSQKTARDRNELMGKGPVFLAYRIIDVLVDSCFPIMNELSSTIERIDKEIEDENSQTTLEDISITRRNIVYFQTMIKPFLPLFKQLEEGKYTELNGEMQQFWSNAFDHLRKIWDRLEDNRELIEGISKSHESLLASKTNEIVKVLTIFSAIMLPLNLFASIYGMNIGLPLANHPYIFTIIITTMLVTATVMLIVFKYKRWF